MKTTKSFKRFTLELFTGIFILTNIFPLGLLSASSSNSPKIVYPVKKVSKLECRYTDYDKLSKDCKQNLPILNTKDYKKYIGQNGGYNDFTRYYTVLWGASYKYGWDVGYGGHQGTDIASSRGTPVYSIADGKVIVAKKALGWGNVVTVEHLIYGRKVFSNYAHLDEIKVKVGQKLYAGDKLGTIGNTGNSTGNHLHLQIDLDTLFHPFYYYSKTCPYSYNRITEDGVCFDELQANTIDPLLFLETKGAIVKNLKISTNKINAKTNQSSSLSNNISNNSIFDVTIFNRTVYSGYSKSDIMKVQQILKDLTLYNGSLSGNYDDIKEIVIKYQLSKNVIENRYSVGAGWFGPKTRAKIKVDYDNFLKSSSNKNYLKSGKDNKNSNIHNTYEKIERKNIMTREQIEQREYESFIKRNEFDLDLKNLGGNIKIGSTAKIDFNIVKKYKNKPFRGNTPLEVSIITDESILDVFPKKFYNFSDGKRQIKLTGKNPGITNVHIKFGSKTIKTYKIRVYSENEKIYLESGIIRGNSKVVLADNVKGMALFTDKTRKKLINIEYKGTYKLKGAGDTKVCIKRGSVKNISRIHKRSCNSGEYKNEIEFSYDDTVAGILFFDYKSIGKNAKVEIINTYNNSILADKKLTVSDPKGLKSNYVYRNDVIDSLRNDVVTNSSRGYFLEDRSITENDSNIWIRNTLNKIKSQSYNDVLKSKVDHKLAVLSQEFNSKNRTITRKEFLEKSYKYLVLDDINNGLLRTYRDLDDDFNRKAYAIFGDSLTWRDRFGENYFQPNKQITRGEVAFILNTKLIRNTGSQLSSR